MPSVRSGMSIGILLMLILSSLLIVLSASKAHAQTSCDTELNTLRSAITSANFTNEKDRNNLLLKVDAAETKLSQGKTPDAVAKIQDIKSAVNKLAAGNKFGSADAQAINDAADAAIACLQPSSGT
jgi:hypothetical protein